MKTYTQLPPPGHGRAIALWLLSIVLGTGFLALVSGRPTTENSWFPAGPLLLSITLALLFSLPAFALFPVTSSILRALNSHYLLQRHGRLLVVMSSLFGATALTAYCFTGWLVWLFSGTGQGWQITFMFRLTAPYLPALLVAAYLLYGKWLFRPDESPV